MGHLMMSLRKFGKKKCAARTLWTRLFLTCWVFLSVYWYWRTSFVAKKKSFWLELSFLRLNVYFKCSVSLRIWFQSLSKTGPNFEFYILILYQTWSGALRLLLNFDIKIQSLEAQVKSLKLNLRWHSKFAFSNAKLKNHILLEVLKFAIEVWNVGVPNE